MGVEGTGCEGADLLRRQLTRDFHDGDLALILIAMIATEHEHGRSIATRDNGDGDHHICPATKVV
jgi:hypothetical protein